MVIFGVLPSIGIASEEPPLQFSQWLLSIAIVLGLLASVYVYSLSQKMAGGAIARALTLYGTGMLCIVFSLLSVTWLKQFMLGQQSSVHDILFIVGFMFMVFGSRHIISVIK